VDAEDALLAQRVAAAADAWLRDPQDTQVYARLVAATLAWRRGASPVLEATDLLGDARPSAPIEPATAVVLPPRLADTLGEVVANLHRRHSPSSGAADTGAAPPAP